MSQIQCFLLNIVFSVTYCYAHINIHHDLQSKKIPISFIYGFASYYGYKDDTDKHRMANGKIFNKNNLYIASHARLKLGTKLKITNLYNGKIAYVVVSDRMSSKTKAIIDVSYAVAKKLNMLNKGIVRVKIKIINQREYLLHIKKYKICNPLKVIK